MLSETQRLQIVVAEPVAVVVSAAASGCLVELDLFPLQLEVEMCSSSSDSSHYFADIVDIVAVAELVG